MSNVKYLEDLTGKLIADIKAERVDASVFSEFKVKSQELYERNILDQLEIWHEYFKSPKPKDLSWIEHMFAANPKLAKDLISSLYALTIERERVNQQALILLNQDPGTDVSNMINVDGVEHMQERVEGVSQAFGEIESTITDILKNGYLSQGALGVSSSMLIEHMNENSKHLFKGVKCSSLSVYKMVAIIAGMFLLCTTGFMIHQYFTAFEVLIVNFVENMILSVLATAILAVNSIVMLRGFYQRRNRSNNHAQLALSSANDNEFEDIDLGDDKAGKRTHQFEMIRCLLQGIYSTVNRAEDAQQQGQAHYQSIKQHIERNEKTLNDLLDPLYQHFQSEAGQNTSWLDHLFSVKPKLAQQLIDKLFKLEEFRKEANLKIIAYCYASPAEKSQQEDDMQRFLDRRHETVANLERQITAFNQSIKNLSTLCVQQRPDGASLYAHMSNNFAQEVKKKSNKDLKIHAVIQIVSCALILFSTGFMGYFFLSNQQSFHYYFIAAASVAISSILALCIDSYCITKMVNKSDRIMNSKHIFHIPDAMLQETRPATSSRVLSSFSYHY
jgi:hypothetical protein